MRGERAGRSDAKRSESPAAYAERGRRLLPRSKTIQALWGALLLTQRQARSLQPASQQLRQTADLVRGLQAASERVVSRDADEARVGLRQHTGVLLAGGLCHRVSDFVLVQRVPRHAELQPAGFPRLVFADPVVGQLAQRARIFTGLQPVRGVL